MPRRGPDRGPLRREDLPDELTADAVRGLDVRTIRQLMRPGNGVLDADEQRTFDAALRSVMEDTTSRLDQSLRRASRGGPRGFDPDLRRSYDRTQARLAAQAARTRQAFPQFTEGWELPAGSDVRVADPSTTASPPRPGEPSGTAVLPPVEDADDAGAVDDHVDDGISLGELEAEIDQTSDTLEILERIASIQQQQLEHQRSQLLRDTRGVFFALVVSIAVIIAGVAPLVEASPHDRRLIIAWTSGICVAAGIAYAIIRALQPNGDDDSPPG